MIRNIDELTELEKLALIPISYSRLSLFQRCPAAYYYTYIQFEAQQFGPAASLGSIIHEALEKNDYDEPLTVENINRLFEEYRPKHDPDNLIDDRLLEAKDEMIVDFVARHEDEEFNIVGKEVPFAIVVGQALIVGFIDRVDRLADDYLHIIDWKTGSFEVTNKAAPDNLQLGIYALAMSHMYPNHKIRADLYYLRTGRMKGAEFPPDKLLEVENRLVDLVNDLVDCQNFGYTDDKFNCRWCDHCVSGVCPTGSRRWPQLVKPKD